MKKTETDEELLIRSKSGDSEAVNLLIARYKPLVLRLSRARYLAGGDREDLIQEGMIGLFQAVRDFDPENGSSFLNFAALCVNRQMLHAIEAAGREKNRLLNDSVTLEDAEWEQLPLREAVSPEEIVIGKEFNDERVGELLEKLSPMEQKVLKLYLDGLDYKEIAEVLKKSPKSIDNALQRIRRKVR